MAKLHTFSKEELTSICTAIAFHHFCDKSIQGLQDAAGKADEAKLHAEAEASQWYVTKHHPLLFLLVLCDTLAQWGRTREQKEDAWRAQPILDEEKRRDVRLHSITINRHVRRVFVEQHYPQHGQQVVDKFLNYTKVPLNCLNQSGGKGTLEVSIAWEGWKGSDDLTSRTHCDVKLP